VTKTAFPALNSDDGATRLENVEFESVGQTKTDTVVNLWIIIRQCEKSVMVKC
jgi:hypothetical protein